MKLKIATSQFSVSSDVELNRDTIIRQTQEAKDKNCQIIHFPEGSLSGYAGVDFASFEGYHWDLLKQCAQKILDLAKALDIWIILGSSHQLTGTNKPRNSLYIIDNGGRIVDRYDKLFCAGDNTYQTGDLAHYSSGNHFSLFVVSGIKCSVLICHDYRYPELYRELKKQGVELIFHSYHAGNMSEQRQKLMESQIGEPYFSLNPGKTYPEITMPATMISYAGNNYVWVSCSNTSARESCWGSFIVRPDGIITGRLEKNVEGILMTEIDTAVEYYDSTKFWRKRAINGCYYSGDMVVDRRSENRNEL
jgi:predicted amidohydrolase